MFSWIFKRAHKGKDAASTVDKDGAETNFDLHMDMISEADDSINTRVARKALEGKVSKEVLDKAYPAK